jgi:hypothetical protein
MGLVGWWDCIFAGYHPCARHRSNQQHTKYGHFTSSVLARLVSVKCSMGVSPEVGSAPCVPLQCLLTTPNKHDTNKYNLADSLYNANLSPC